MKNYFKDIGATSRSETHSFSDGKGGQVDRTVDYLVDLEVFLTGLIESLGYKKPILSLSMDSGQGQFLFTGKLGDLEGKFQYFQSLNTVEQLVFSWLIWRH